MRDMTDDKDKIVVTEQVYDELGYSASDRDGVTDQAGGTPL